uniref:Uncharacterized protein n=1 Tax=Arundo donax TaxID=35708 RepID=A0A0A9H9S0_ARUDO
MPTEHINPLLRTRTECGEHEFTTKNARTLQWKLGTESKGGILHQTRSAWKSQLERKKIPSNIRGVAAR